LAAPGRGTHGVEGVGFRLTLECGADRLPLRRCRLFAPHTGAIMPSRR